MSAPEPIANPILREYVTSVGFNLTLTRGMIHFLVYQDVVRANGYDKRGLTDNRAGKPDTFISSGRACERRGLIVWTPQDTRPGTPGYRRIRRMADKLGISPNQSYLIQLPDNIRITKAGRLVIGLLKESGLYAEVEAKIRQPELQAVAS